MGIPFHHYYGAENNLDPRFAWRMLMDAEVKSCNVELRQDGSVVNLTSNFGAHWMSLAVPGRIHVARAMARRLCALKPLSRVTIEMRCTLYGGEERVLSDGTGNECRGSP